MFFLERTDTRVAITISRVRFPSCMLSVGKAGHARAPPDREKLERKRQKIGRLAIETSWMSWTYILVGNYGDKRSDPAYMPYDAYSAIDMLWLSSSKAGTRVDMRFMVTPLVTGAGTFTPDNTKCSNIIPILHHVDSANFVLSIYVVFRCPRETSKHQSIVLVS